MALLASVVLAVLAGVVTSLDIANGVNRITRAGNGTQAFAEQIKQPVDDGIVDMTYVPCATPSTYPDLVVDLPPSYSAEIIQVEYLAGFAGGRTNWSNSCGTDLGLQRITIEVKTGTASIDKTETVRVVKRDARCVGVYSPAFDNVDNGPC